MDTMKDTTMQHVTDVSIVLEAAAEFIAGLLERIETAEKDIALKERIIDSIGSILTKVVNERDELRANIEQMEKQEPVAFVDYKLGNCFRWAEYLGWQKIKDGARLYTLSGAQPAPSVPEGISRVSPDFYWDSAKQHHIPTVLVEFEPVPVGSPNDVKGWQDRDRFAALISGAKGE